MAESFEEARAELEAAIAEWRRGHVTDQRDRDLEWTIVGWRDTLRGYVPNSAGAGTSPIRPQSGTRPR